MEKYNITGNEEKMREGVLKTMATSQRSWNRGKIFLKRQRHGGKDPPGGVDAGKKGKW